MNVFILVLALVLTACVQGGPTGGVEARNVELCRSLSASMAPVESTTAFQPDERINLAVRLQGRPQRGVVRARFFLRETLLSSSSIDLAEVNSGLWLSAHQDTLLGFWMDHAEPLPVARSYRAEVSVDGQRLERRHFEVLPPDGAINTRLVRAVLAKGVTDDFEPIAPTRRFEPADEVVLVGLADIGRQSWVHVEWTSGDVLHADSTGDLVAWRGERDVGFAFRARPKGGWPEGVHRVVLRMNDRVVGRHSFRVSSAATSEQ